MAQHQPGNSQGITDKNRATADSAAKSDGSVSAPATYDSHDDLDTALATADAGYFTQSRLDKMTLNDKVYALRLANDSGTF